MPVGGEYAPAFSALPDTRPNVDRGAFRAAAAGVKPRWNAARLPALPPTAVVADPAERLGGARWKAPVIRRVRTLMFADFGQTWKVIAASVGGLLLLGGLGCLVVKGYRRYSAAAERAEARAYQDVVTSRTPGPGMVGVVFHTYWGLLVFVRQDEHRFWAAPDDARLVLARLHRFNLTWGFFAYGAMFIPMLSSLNYWRQRKQISRQAGGPTT
jgi:hypothetical protein